MASSATSPGEESEPWSDDGDVGNSVPSFDASTNAFPRSDSRENSLSTLPSLSFSVSSSSLLQRGAPGAYGIEAAHVLDRPPPAIARHGAVALPPRDSVDALVAQALAELNAAIPTLSATASLVLAGAMERASATYDASRIVTPVFSHTSSESPANSPFPITPSRAQQIPLPRTSYIPAKYVSPSTSAPPFGVFLSHRTAHLSSVDGRDVSVAPSSGASKAAAQPFVPSVMRPPTANNAPDAVSPSPPPKKPLPPKKTTATAKKAVKAPVARAPATVLQRDDESEPESQAPPRKRTRAPRKSSAKPPLAQASASAHAYQTLASPARISSSQPAYHASVPGPSRMTLSAMQGVAPYSNGGRPSVLNSPAADNGWDTQVDLRGGQRAREGDRAWVPSVFRAAPAHESPAAKRSRAAP